MKPFIVLAFANDKDDYLPMIVRESKGDNTARLWQVSKMPLEQFLKKGNLEKLTEENRN